MRIAHVDYDFIFELNENDRGILVVENAKTFRTIVSQLIRSLIDKEEIFIFSENNKVIKAWEKIDLVINPMEIEINSKKLIGRLYDKMREEVNETDLLIDNNMLFQNIEGFFLHIADNFDFDLTYKEKIELTDILKMLDVKIVEELAFCLFNLDCRFFPYSCPVQCIKYGSGCSITDYDSIPYRFNPHIKHIGTYPEG